MEGAAAMTCDEAKEGTMSGLRSTIIMILSMCVLAIAACGGDDPGPLICLPGGSSCVDGVPSICNGVGTALTPGAPCGTGEFCSDGACVLEEVPDDVVDADVPVIDTYQPECEEDDDCNKILGGLADCQRAVCDKGTCIEGSVEDGIECEDGICVEAECLPVVCPAGETVCGDDAGFEDAEDSVVECNEFGTAIVGEPSPCDDGSLCNGDERCDEGSCTDEENLDCDDGDPCTEDKCDPITGCSSEVFEGPCEDGNLCTEDDQCVDGTCISGGSVDCFDNNVCTKDSCDMFNGCVYAITNESGICDDGQPCTAGDSCVLGTCTPVWDTDCDDDNPCTIDTCNEELGCEYVTEEDGLACDDGSVCTGAEACLAGFCVVSEGTSLDCDDDNQCTTDSCDPVGGCQNESQDGTVCDDGVACSDGDICSEGVCLSDQPILSEECAAPPEALCGIVGPTGSFAICDFELARTQESGESAVGLQLVLEYDASVVEVVQFQDLFCFGIGEEENCQVLPIPSADSNEIAKGHIIAIAPLLMEDWDGAGTVLLYKFSASASLTDAWMDQDSVMGDPYLMQILVEITADIEMSAPSYLLMKNISASNASADAMAPTVQQGLLLVE